MATPLDFSGVNPVGTPSATDVFNAGSNAISFREQLPDLETKLREALTTKFNESPLFKQRETAAQEFLAAPSALNKKITDIQAGGTILSPNQQQEITGAGRAAAFAPLSTSNLLLGTAFGGLENMIGGGVKAFEAASTAQTERANLLNKLREQEMDRSFKEKQLALGYARLNKQGAINKTQQAAMLDFAQMPTILQQLRDQQKLARGRVTGLGSKIKGLFGFQPDVTSYEAYKNAVATPIARTLFGEKGNLSDTDIKRAIGLLPTATDTPEEAERKLGYIEQLANAKYAAIQSLGGDIETGEWEIIE